ncbi:uncharacterized protein EHS24_003609 [Apiotrichum porosum]|uniref:Uncharacterized protein n=1 Tax=Apiotrichum porosum TaxID=105984 RepID=A0A427XEF7_9TREE|nr:uncharacterized protein EHS24_003609 [Apiotrichum porosum]RSH77299.1 hypothetical protein EHS24_003609 [Apiotrichum porosum]
MIEIVTPAGGDNFASEVRVKFEDTSAVVRFDEMKDGMSAVEPGGPWWPGALEHAVLYAQNLTPLQVCDPKLGGYVFESMRALFGHDGASYDVPATVANKAEVLQALKSCQSRVVVWCTSPEEPGITLPRGLVGDHCWAVSAYKEFIGGTVQLEDPNGGQVTVTNVDAIFTCTDTEASVFIDYEKDPNAPPPLPIASPSATQCDPSSSSEATTSSPTSTPSTTPTTNPENGNEGAQKAVEAAAAAAAGTGPGVVAAIETATAGLSGLALLVALYLLDIARKASDGGGSGQDVYDAVQKAVSVEEAKGGTAVPGDVVTVTLNGSEVPVTITSESAAQVTMSGDGALVPATGDGALVPVATPSTNDTL